MEPRPQVQYLEVQGYDILHYLLTLVKLVTHLLYLRDLRAEYRQEHCLVDRGHYPRVAERCPLRVVYGKDRKRILLLTIVLRMAGRNELAEHLIRLRYELVFLLYLIDLLLQLRI